MANTNLTISEPPMMFGVYVTSISASMGYGASGSNLQLGLVEDPDRLDANGNPAPLLADFPQVGTACQFAFQGFVFAGIFQRYSKKKSTSGNTYDVVIEAPAKVLDGVQVILDSFEGTAFTGAHPFFPGTEEVNFTSQISNIYNPFGIRENHSFGGFFGNADVNSAGMPAREVLGLIEEISKSQHTYTNPTGPSADTSVDADDNELIGGPINFGETKFLIDFGELKDKVPEFFRLKGPSQNLNGIIQECCDVIIHDYTVTIEPVVTQVPVSPQSTPASVSGFVGGSQPTNTVDTYINGPLDTQYDADGKVIGPIISIKIMDKSEAPNPGVVQSLVDSYETSGKLVSANTGKELSSNATQKLVVGGPASRYWEVPMSYLIPVWGKFENGRFSVGSGYNSDDDCPIVIPDGSNEIYHATILEVRCAMAGKEAWETYHTVKAIQNDPSNFTPIGNMMPDLNRMRRGQTLPIDITNTSGKFAADRASAASQGLNPSTGEASLTPFNKERIFSAVEKAAKEFYGQQFLVFLPLEPGGERNNIRFVSEDMETQTPWEISASAWDKDFRARDISFYDGEGKIKACAGYYKSGKRDFSTLEDRAAIYIDQFGTSLVGTDKITVEKDIYWESSLTYGGEIRPYAHVKVPQVLEYDSLNTETDELTKLVFNCVGMMSQPGFGNFGPGAAVGGVNDCFASAPSFLKFTRGNNAQANPSYYLYNVNVGHTALYGKAVRPFAIGIPQQSNRYTWGPWYLFNSKNGKAEIEIDGSLRPETFGSNALMDNAGFAKAFVGTANLYASESGTVELAEFPDYNLAERFGGSGPYVTNIDVSIGTGGCTTNYKFNTWTRNFGKIAKYNQDRISRINKNSIRILQEERNRMGNPPLTPAGGRPNISKIGAPGGFGQGEMVNATFSFLHPVGPQAASADVMPEAQQKRATVTHLNATNTLGSIAFCYDLAAGCSQEQMLTQMAIDKILSSGSPYAPAGQTQPGWTVLQQGFLKNGELAATGVFGASHVGPTSRDIDPYFGFDTNDFSVVVNNDSADFQSSTGDLNTKKTGDGYNDKFAKGEVSQVRTMGLRGPLLLSGWGYDIADQPVPSSGVGDRWPEDAVYDLGHPREGQPAIEYSGKLKFNPTNPALNRDTWKSGPVHLMWDDERRVWSGGLQFVEGKLLEALTPPTSLDEPTFAEVSLRRRVKKVVNGQISEQEYEWKDLDEKITITNRDPSLSVDPSTSTYDIYIMAARINYEWRVVYVSCDDFGG